MMNFAQNSPITRRSVLRGLGLTVGLGAVGTSLAACGVDGSRTKPTSSLPADANKTLVFWHTYTQQARADFMRQVADRFEEANPGVTVKIEVVPLPQYATKWPAAQAAGSLPDVTSLLPENAVSMWLAGALYPASDVFAKLGGSSAFVSGLAEKMGRFQDTQIAIPHYVHNRLLYQRTDLLEQAGVSLPEMPSWEQALDAAQKTTKSPERYGWQLKLAPSDTGGGYLLYMMTHSAGGSLIDGKNGKSMLDTPEVKKAAKFIVELGKTASGPGQVNYNINDDYKLMMAGATVLAEDSAAMMGTVVSEAPDMAKVLSTSFMPKDKQPGNMLGALSVALPKGKNPHLAQKFAEFLFAKENYVPFLHSIPLFMFPTLNSATGPAFYDNPVIQQHDAIVKQTLAGVKTGSNPGFDDGPNPYAGPLFASHEIEKALQSVLVSGTSVDSALKSANSAVQSLFDDVKSRIR
jgi:multiple sugar transport system substrate-binding protein